MSGLTDGKIAALGRDAKLPPGDAGCPDCQLSPRESPALRRKGQKLDLLLSLTGRVKILAFGRRLLECARR